MLEHSFIHFTGIDSTLEQSLWNHGIVDWAGLKRSLPSIKAMVAASFSEVELLNEIRNSEKAIQEKNARYFWDRLPYDQVWRIYGSMPGQFLGLDIETTGLYDPAFVTCVAVFDGNNIYQFSRTKNLDDFYEFWEGKSNSILVTYNGFRFDLPFLLRSMKWKNPLAHVDLMHILHKMGIKGGLKASELQLGIRRADSIQNLSGYEAVQLWNQYVETDQEEYLNLLEEYNQEDTINLHKILAIVHRRNWGKIFPLQPPLFS